MTATGPGADAPTAPQALLDEAVALARAAGDLTLRWFRTAGLEVETKADATPVTAADRAAERHVREHLAATHPDDGIIGEEEGTVEGSSARRWVVDPIDGTYGFVHGVPLYSTLLAVLDDAGPLVGVIHLPALGETVFAGRGLGCFQLDRHGTRPARVNDHAALSGAAVMTSGIDHWPAGGIDALHRLGAKVRTWGDGYGYALVATGRVEAMVDPEVSVWDLAPLPVIIEEAGGSFTTLDGRRDLWGGSGIATNGHLHAAMLEALRPTAT
ncbi:MAG: inositol monophosphatase family protein [Acidimicrobiia bacterium]